VDQSLSKGGVRDKHNLTLGVKQSGLCYENLASLILIIIL
jgi:hypothetical protein